MPESRGDAAAVGYGSSTAPRYEVVLDPADNFLVWDTLDECPATMEAGILACATFDEVQDIADGLNRRAGVRSGFARDCWA